MGQKNGLYAFGYNSAESESIWMKSGTVWAKCWGLALADFGRDPRIINSLRGSQNFVFFCEVNNAQFPCRTNFTTFEHNNVDRCPSENFPNRSLKILPLEIILNNAKITHKILGLATSGHHNSTVITDAKNSLLNDHPLVSIFTIRINSKSSPGCTLRTRKVPAQIFGIVQCPFRYDNHIDSHCGLIASTGHGQGIQ